jgi:hypothetical protein
MLLTNPPDQLTCEVAFKNNSLLRLKRLCDDMLWML